ncbi:MFS transporter [Microbacterium sp. CFH 90308]|uniref:MFS transporter n=1 Tax=Microbacterium salsuginis TaxID=2722803 RepID=A0ABX1KE12_9MICO|nr:MFS transporter [Microbacterium sp. CFH 90308]NLP85276.1 MFS transporter [Microbacterium sp. CFH 90308]
MPHPLPRRRRTPIALLSISHAFVDVYQGAVAALVPFFVLEREYTYAAAATIVLAASLLSSVVQPIFGAVIDRRPMRLFLPASTLVAGAGIALAGVGDVYVFTVIAVGISGFGVAAYHPAAAVAVRAVSPSDPRAMSWFSLGGNVGFALAPLLVVGVMSLGGLEASPLLAVPAVAGAVVCLLALRTPASSRPRQEAPGEQPPPNDWGSFGRLTAAVMCRSVVFVGLSAFVALYVAERTGDGAVGGAVALFILYAGGAAGTLLGGYLAARWPRIAIVRWSYAATIVAVAGIVWVPGPAIYVFVALASAGLYVPFSLHVTLAQDYLPQRVGTASGVTLGLTVSVGGLATPLFGWIADTTTLQIGLVPLIGMPAIGLLFLHRLVEPMPPRREAVLSEVTKR